MKLKHILKILVAILLSILFILLLVIAYFWIVDIQSKAPKEIQEEVNIKEELFMGRKVFVVEAKSVQKSNKKIIYFHGGSYVAEASKMQWEFIKQICKDTKMTVIMPDYPLTPKYNYKDVFRMVTPLYKEIIERVKAQDIILLGDSAGGGLSLALYEKLKEEKVDLPSKVILISPWLDVRLENPQIDEVQKNDKILNRDTLKLAGIAYAGEDGMYSYLVNPIDGNLKGLENITIFTGTYDILNPDAKLLAKKANEVGVNVNIKEYEKANHIWIIDKNCDEELVKRGYHDLLENITENVGS